MKRDPFRMKKVYSKKDYPVIIPLNNFQIYSKQLLHYWVVQLNINKE